MGGAVFWYVQTRLQARHGARMEEAEWQALEGAQTFLRYLDRTRTAPLGRLTELIPSDASAHVVERKLREARREYISEIASWMPPSWQLAVRWTAILPDLPVLSYLLNGGAAWPYLLEDPVLGPPAQAPPAARREALIEAGLGSLVGEAGQVNLVTAWLDRWRLLWPSVSQRERRELDTLIAGAAYHFERSAYAAPDMASVSLRRGLARHLNRSFRGSTARPAAVFSHLGLVSLEIDRVRGGLLRRLLLQNEKSARAA